MRQVARVERGDEVRLDQVRAARHVDQARTARQQREGARVEDAARFGRERQQADQRAALRQHGVQPVRTREAFDAVDFLLPPAPAADPEVEREQALRDASSQLAEPEQADGALGGEALRQRPPGARGLLRAVAVQVAVPVEHAREHGLAHRRDHARIDQARERRAARQGRVREQAVHPHPQRLDQLERREVAERADGRLRHQRDFDRRRVGDLGPDVKARRRQRGAQARQPALRVLLGRDERDLHAASCANAARW